MASRGGVTKAHIAALDGLRFIAALCVMAAHGYWYLICLQQDSNLNTAAQLVMRLSCIGMTLFFVLSGFVVHLNYRVSIQRPGGYRHFFIARFTRLYPLFLVVFGIEIIRIAAGSGYGVRPEGGWLEPILLFLSFTESWWFFPLGHRPALDAIGGATGLMWSLSTEAFFYLCYPLVAPFFGRAHGRTLLASALTITALAVALPLIALYCRAAINEWSARQFGQEMAGPFFQWLTFYSPWLRVLEFMIGVCAAQFFCLASERKYVAFVGYIAIAVCIGIYVAGLGHPISGLVTTCLSPLIAVVVYSATSPQTRLASWLSTPFMVKGGAASYSLYLLHYFILHDLGRPAVLSAPLVSRLFVYFFLMLISIGFAHASYVSFERPVTAKLRAALERSRPKLIAAAG